MYNYKTYLIPFYLNSQVASDILDFILKLELISKLEENLHKLKSNLYQYMNSAIGKTIIRSEI